MVVGSDFSGPPLVTYAYQQSVLKEEDVLLVNPTQQYPADKSNDASSSLRSTELNGFAFSSIDCHAGSGSDERPGMCGLFVVCDGHNGVAAAQYVVDQLPAYLDDLLPPGAPPPESDAKAYVTWRHGLQRALTISLALLHRAFAGMGVLAGCTVTIVLQHDWLLTCANLGDSRAIVDTGREVTLLTDDHRVATHKLERRRLEKRGATIAPVDISGRGPAQGKRAVGVGPLRLWPGGLCLSRAVGDFDVGDSVLSLPFITQVKLPREGARLILASDGVWDAFHKTSRVSSIVRSTATQAAPQKVISNIINMHEGIKDDTSLVVVDFLPPGKSFAECTRFGAGMGCMCMGNKHEDPEAPPPRVEIVEQVDTAHLAGLMPDHPEAMPAWFTKQLSDELHDTMEQAMEIWEKASGLRRQGRVPSIADFEQLIVAARTEKTSVAAAVHQASLEDMSVRMGGTGTTPSIFPQSSSAGSFDANPSVRFGNSVAATPEEFGEKFGHYGRQRHASLDARPSYIGTRAPSGASDSALEREAAEARESYIEGHISNPYVMRSLPRPAPQPPRHSAADFSVRAGQELYRTPAPGTAGGGQAINWSTRGGEPRVPAVDPTLLKTYQGSSVPASPPKSGLLRTSIDSLRRISAGVRRASSSSEGMSSQPDADGSSREGSYGKRRQRLPMTELQSGTPAMATRQVGVDGERVRGGKPTKSVAFSDSAREASPLNDE